jgi:superfamily II DNA or RNA helicase
MASEGLDIKSLTTLFMVTPKTDIEQTVGRILREKHKNPIVVDIIDSHSIFQNQWKKRRAFYIKENYKIIHTNNSVYNTDTNSSEWETLYEPGDKSKKYCKKIQKKDEDPLLQGHCFIKIKK